MASFIIEFHTLLGVVRKVLEANVYSPIPPNSSTFQIVGFNCLGREVEDGIFVQFTDEGKKRDDGLDVELNETYWVEKSWKFINPSINLDGSEVSDEDDSPTASDLEFIDDESEDDGDSNVTSEESEEDGVSEATTDDERLLETSKPTRVTRSTKRKMFGYEPTIPSKRSSIEGEESTEISDKDYDEEYYDEEYDSSSDWNPVDEIV